MGYPVLSSGLPGGGAASGPTLSPTGEEIRTIFVTGFPPNVHERELHNLVCFLPGYEASQVRAGTVDARQNAQQLGLIHVGLGALSELRGAQKLDSARLAMGSHIDIGACRATHERTL